MKIGIMQPYFLPYIGYFALINAVNKFVYLDDVQYIRRGWVNRNRIKVADTWKYITLPVVKAPRSIPIMRTYIVNHVDEIHKIIKSLKYSYERAPHYNLIKDMIVGLILPGVNLSQLNICLTAEICRYLDINTEFYVSSEIPQDSSLKAEDKIINICNILKANHYINPPGGLELYSSANFNKHRIKLNFLQMKEIIYYQGKGAFVPNLSMIDVLMWNDKESIRNMLNEYTLLDGAV